MDGEKNISEFEKWQQNKNKYVVGLNFVLSNCFIPNNVNYGMKQAIEEGHFVYIGDELIDSINKFVEDRVKSEREIILNELNK